MALELSRPKKEMSAPSGKMSLKDLMGEDEEMMEGEMDGEMEEGEQDLDFFTETEAVMKLEKMGYKVQPPAEEGEEDMDSEEEMLEDEMV